jgi:hypothetical protein
MKGRREGGRERVGRNVGLYVRQTGREHTKMMVSGWRSGVLFLFF